MTFLAVSALSIVLFAAAPFAAHLLRRRRTEEQPFPPATLVPGTETQTRRRRALEDRLLLGIRVLALVALALLSATPFTHCAALTLARRDGASVALAIVLDDSLSMRAKLGSGVSRFSRALRAARELTASLGEGDAVALVLAGFPARVALASTTSIALATKTLERVAPSNRATDLDGALRIARSLLERLPYHDKRIALFSDLADGSPPGAPPLAGTGDVTLWQALPELEADGSDCAILGATRTGLRVKVRIACTSSTGPPPTAAMAEAGPVWPSRGRHLQILDGKRVLVSTPLDGSLRTGELSVELPPDAPNSALAFLTGKDAIAEDDVAPVVASAGAPRIATVVDLAATRVATGGATPLEQAFRALESDAEVRPLSSTPERADALSDYSVLIVDDAPGLTPDARRAVLAWVERGGVVLLTLGPVAACAPLGANFEPLLPGVLRWAPTAAPGISPISAEVLLGASADGLVDIAPRGRTTLAPEAVIGAEVLGRWLDGAPFFLRRSVGRGVVFVLTLPLATDDSNFVLRPAFLPLLDHVVNVARSRGAAGRIDVGDAWTLEGHDDIGVTYLPNDARTPPTPIAVTASSDGEPSEVPGRRVLKAVAPLAGLYALRLDGEATVHVATVPEREIDLRPRRMREAAFGSGAGNGTTSVDVSAQVAVVLLSLIACEAGLRLAEHMRRVHTSRPS